MLLTVHTAPGFFSRRMDLAVRTCVLRIIARAGQYIDMWNMPRTAHLKLDHWHLKAFCLARRQQEYSSGDLILTLVNMCESNENGNEIGHMCFPRGNSTK